MLVNDQVVECDDEHLLVLPILGVGSLGKTALAQLVYNNEKLDALQQRVWEVLSHKRCLLVLDDVWNNNQEDCERLRSILAYASKGLSVVVTTCLGKVADVMGTDSTHSLKRLSEEHLWLLFKLRAFGQEGGEHPRLEVIGQQIVKKSVRVPLA